MAVTLAPGTTKPRGSVTVPEISPPTSARRTGIHRSRRDTKRSATKIARGRRQEDDMQHLHNHLVKVASRSKRRDKSPAWPLYISREVSIQTGTTGTGWGSRKCGNTSRESNRWAKSKERKSDEPCEI